MITELMETSLEGASDVEKQSLKLVSGSKGTQIYQFNLKMR